MECIELNWLCKHRKKIRSRQPAIPYTELSKTQLFPGVSLILIGEETMQCQSIISFKVSIKKLKEIKILTIVDVSIQVSL